MRNYIRFSNVCQDVSRKTGVPYVVVKAIMRSYLHHLFNQLRKFILSPNYYFKVVPQQENLENLKEVELNRAFRYYRSRVAQKRQVRIKLRKSRNRQRVNN